ncbi:monocarboxylate transporter 5 [Nematostella vectensis]|uniref:monocarboxylate transporter 5 n=1 Tax=Nematostella vectensis TaxID=45351 RepID=UPI002076F896|nr:monocarboxylate transporter 5 [Nematostella vectensis]
MSVNYTTPYSLRPMKSGNGYFEYFTHKYCIPLNRPSMVCGRAPHPQDGAWAWLCCLSAAVCNSLHFGFTQSFGVFLPILAEVFNENREKTAWAGSIALFLTFLVGPVAALLSQRFSPRTVTLVSGLLCAASLLSTSFATSIVYIYFTYGVLFGTGAGCILNMGYAVARQYFTSRYRSLTTGVIASGAGVGVIMTGPILQAVIDAVGWRDTLRVMSGIMLIICVLSTNYDIDVLNKNADEILGGVQDLSKDNQGGSLNQLEPKLEQQGSDSNKKAGKCEDNSNKKSICSEAEKYEKSANPEEDSNEEKGVIGSLKQNANYKVGKSENNSSRVFDGERKNIDKMADEKNANNELDEMVGSHAKKDSDSSSFTDNVKEKIDRGQQNVNLDTDNASPDVPPADNQTNPSGHKTHCLETFIDCSVWNNRLFVIGAIAIFLAYLPLFVPNIHIVRFATDLHISSDKASWLFTYIGVTSTVCRAIIGKVLDMRWVTPLQGVQISSLLMGVSIIALGSATEYTHFVVFAVFYGVGNGIFVTTQAVFFQTSVAPSKSAMGMGMGFMTCSVAILIGPPICGLIADKFGSYIPSFYVLGGVDVAAALFPWILCLFRDERHPMAQSEEVCVSPRGLREHKASDTVTKIIPSTS